MQTSSPAAPFFRRMFMLLILYWLVSVIGAVKFLGADTLATVLPYHQSSALANVLLVLAILSGILGGVTGTFPPASARMLRVMTRVWTFFIALAALLALLGVTEGRTGLELPPLLDLALIALLAGFGALISQHRSMGTGSGLIVLVGLGCIIAGLIVGLMPANTFLNDRSFRVIAVGLIHNVGFVLTAWSLLAARPSAPAENSLLFSGGLLIVWGFGMTLPGLHTLIDSPILTLLGWLALPGLPALAWIVVRGTAPLISPERRSALTVLAQGSLLAASVIGGINALPAANPWLAGTRLTDVQAVLVTVTVLAALMATVLPGPGRSRAWFVAGVGVASLALIAAGIGQVTAERIQGIGYLESQQALIPIYVLWTAGLLIAGAATLILARRIRESRS